MSNFEKVFAVIVVSISVVTELEAENTVTVAVPVTEVDLVNVVLMDLVLLDVVLVDVAGIEIITVRPYP